MSKEDLYYIATSPINVKNTNLLQKVFFFQAKEHAVKIVWLYLFHSFSTFFVFSISINYDVMKSEEFLHSEKERFSNKNCILLFVFFSLKVMSWTVVMVA